VLTNINFNGERKSPRPRHRNRQLRHEQIPRPAKALPAHGDVRGLVLMTGTELVKDEKLTPAATEAEALRDALLRYGALVGVGGIYGNVIRFQPPLIITRQQIDQAMDTFAAVLQEVRQPTVV
jgi:4-aminobutyrate aminotransferase-like enzyme